MVRAPSRTLRLAACAAVLSIGGSHPLGAQGPPGGIGIEDVLVATLKENPDVRIARAAVDAGRGAVVHAARPFDPRPAATVTGTRTERSAIDGPQDTPTYSTLFPESLLGLSKMFRTGATVTSQFLVSRTMPDPLDRTRLNQFTVTAGLTLPLKQGRGGGVYTAVERAAELDHTASTRTLRAAASAAVRAATLAYWDYRAAYEQADIQRAAAGRARQSVDEVKILIAADERPRSDIDLMMANAATKHAGEVEAERRIAQARHALARAIGLDLEAVAALAAPETPFPSPDGAGPLPLDGLIAGALSRHDELAAASTRRDSARVLRDGAARQLDARLDLVLASSYTGRIGGGTFGRGSDSLPGNAGGSNVSLQVVFEPSSIDSSLRGALIEADAASVQAAVASDRLARSIRINIADALASLESSRAQIASTREAIARSRLALETVQRNFELGTATLFDRILAEDTVTNAELADLGASLQYARSLVNLQFARGVLVGGDGVDLVADPRRVLLASREDDR